MTLWDVNGITLKKKGPKIKIQVEYAKFGKEIYVANLVNQIQNLTKKALRLV